MLPDLVEILEPTPWHFFNRKQTGEELYNIEADSAQLYHCNLFREYLVEDELYRVEEQQDACKQYL